MLTKQFVVQLCIDCWLAPWDGDPGRTLQIDNALRFDSRKKAEKALAEARKYRPFPDAFVDKVRMTVI